MAQLTFKQYLEGKEQLRKAIENTPTTIVEYEVRKYCSIVIGESKEDGKIVGLKPKQKLIIQWRYDNLENPTPDYVKFVGNSSLDEEQQTVSWSGQKLHKWLMRHAKEGRVHGH
ncbi:MAG: hypothetical protein E4H14_06960 [Candidatus Thorarchaeota archaeon]|nr:MAG: hypothetical protein E4H14_06960 [Candidatus Thorarchaeota archaeon]